MKKIKKILFLLMILLVICVVQVMAFQDPVDPENGHTIPSMVALVASVAILTEFIKVFMSKFNIVIEGKFAVVLAMFSSLVVVGYHAMMAGAGINMDLIKTLIEVVIGSTMGFKMLKMAGGSHTLKNLAGKILKEMK